MKGTRLILAFVQEAAFHLAVHPLPQVWYPSIRIERDTCGDIPYRDIEDVAGDFRTEHRIWELAGDMRRQGKKFQFILLFRMPPPAAPTGVVPVSTGQQ